MPEDLHQTSISLETLNQYELNPLIAQEVDYARHILTELGLVLEQTYLFGSGARGGLRTTEDDPQDPSDIDLLVTVPDECHDMLDKMVKDGALSRTRAAGVTSYLAKISSTSGRLNPTEIEIYTDTELQNGLASFEPGSTQREFLEAALNGVKIPAEKLPEEGAVPKASP